MLGICIARQPIKRRDDSRRGSLKAALRHTGTLIANVRENAKNGSIRRQYILY